MGKLKLENQKDYILSLFDSGISTVLIAKNLGEYQLAVANIIKAYRPGIRLMPDLGNIHYFETIDSYSKAYILGFIAADGSLVKNKWGPITLTITIKYEDKAVLEFIKSEIGNTHKLLEIQRPSSFDKTKIIHHIRYSISNKYLASDIMKYGITYNKSLTMGNIIENIPYLYRDAFIIGYFDGDGSVSYLDKTSLNVSIRGTKEFLIGICNHLHITLNHIHMYDSIPNLSFANKIDIKRFFECYNNLSFYYKRKYDKFYERINHIS